MAFDKEFSLKRSRFGGSLSFGHFRLYTVNPGTGPAEACESLALVAPALAFFNGDPLYALPDEGKDAVSERLWATMCAGSRAYENGLRPHGCLSLMTPADMGATAFYVPADVSTDQVYRDLVNEAPSVALYWGAIVYAAFGESVDVVRKRHRDAYERVASTDPSQMQDRLVVRPWRNRWVALRFDIDADVVIAECPDREACEAAARISNLQETARRFRTG